MVPTLPRRGIEGIQRREVVRGSRVDLLQAGTRRKGCIPSSSLCMRMLVVDGKLTWEVQMLAEPVFYAFSLPGRLRGFDKLEREGLGTDRAQCRYRRS